MMPFPSHGGQKQKPSGTDNRRTANSSDVETGEDTTDTIFFHVSLGVRVRHRHMSKQIRMQMVSVTNTNKYISNIYGIS